MTATYVRSILLNGNDRAVSVETPQGSTLRTVLTKAKAEGIVFGFGRLLVSNRSMPLSALDKPFPQDSRIMFVEEERPTSFDLDSF